MLKFEVIEGGAVVDRIVAADAASVPLAPGQTVRADTGADFAGAASDADRAHPQRLIAAARNMPPLAAHPGTAFAARILAVVDELTKLQFAAASEYVLLADTEAWRVAAGATGAEWQAWFNAAR